METHQAQPDELPQDRHFEWWHHSHPTFAGITGFFAGMLFVTALPGASAVLAGLSLSGLPTDRFLYAGFPPPKQAARRKWLAELQAVQATLVLLESPQRLADSLADMAAVLGPREAAVAR